MSPWAPWAHGPLGPWALGPMGLGPMSPWAHGPLSPWAHGPMGPWAHGPLGPWALGPLGPWAHGPKIWKIENHKKDFALEKNQRTFRSTRIDPSRQVIMTEAIFVHGKIHF